MRHGSETHTTGAAHLGPCMKLPITFVVPLSHTSESTRVTFSLHLPEDIVLTLNLHTSPGGLFQIAEAPSLMTICTSAPTFSEIKLKLAHANQENEAQLIHFPGQFEEMVFELVSFSSTGNAWAQTLSIQIWVFQRKNGRSRRHQLS